jgi:hypothetical protein
VSGIVTYLLGEGVLRIPPDEGTGRRFGSVSLAQEGGWLILTGVPTGIRAELVAVKFKKVTTSRKRWFRRGSVVRTKTLEIPVALGVGRVFTTSLGNAPTPDAVGVKPDRPSPGPWLDVQALREVEGHPVRLLLIRTAEVRAEEHTNPSRKER